MIDARNDLAFLIGKRRTYHGKYHRSGTAGLFVSLLHPGRHTDRIACANRGVEFDIDASHEAAVAERRDLLEDLVSIPKRGHEGGRRDDAAVRTRFCGGRLEVQRIVVADRSAKARDPLGSYQIKLVTLEGAAHEVRFVFSILTPT